MAKRVIIQITCTVILAICLDAFVQYELFSQYQNRILLETSYKLVQLRTKLEEELIYNLLLAKGAANFVAIDAEHLNKEKFDRYARSMIDESPALKNIGLAKGYVIQYAYPLQGNEKIIGMDYRNVPKQFPKVKEAADTGNLCIDGPLKLIQGGMGIIGRAPIMIRDNEGQRHFWGLVSTVIDVDRLFANIRPFEGEIAVAFRNETDQVVFWGDPKLFAGKTLSLTMEVMFPGGKWSVIGAPLQAASSHLDIPFTKSIHALSIILVILICLGFYKSYQSNLIILQTQENLRQAQSLAHLGTWAVDLSNNQLWWSEEVFRIFGLDPQTKIPTLDQILALCHPDDVESIKRELEITEKTGKPYALDHRIILQDGSIRYVQARGEIDLNASGKQRYFHGTLLDISQRKKIELALKASEEMTRAMAEASLDAFVTIDTEDTILFWSPAAENMFGWTKEEVLGRQLHQIIVPERFRNTAYNGIDIFSRTGTGPLIGKIQEVVAIRKDGSEFPADLSVAPFKLGDEYFAQGSVRDASKRKESEEWLNYLATTDELTGLKNRRYFLERSKDEIKRSGRYQFPLSLIILDIDHFKSINDSYGHDIGDKVLKQIAQTMSLFMREQDILGRYGGEEFTILLPHTPISGAEEVAERIRLQVENNVLTLDDGRSIHYTISLGIAQLNDPSATLDNLLNNADKALYRAKESGRNCCASG